MRKLMMLAILFVTPALAAVPAPTPSISTLAELPIVIRQPYDEKANADAAVKAAFARARIEHKRVFLDLGGNWCPDCIVLANFLQLPEIKAFMSRYYVVEAIDVGRFDKNLQVPAHFGFTSRLKGVPTILIADAGGKLVNGNDVFAFTDARHMEPQGLVDYLAHWAGSAGHPKRRTP